MVMIASFGECFTTGLARVAKPVQGNPNYADILGSRVDRFMENYAVPEPDSLGGMVGRALENKRYFRNGVVPGAAVSYGRSRNNRREFNFLRSFLGRQGLDSQLFNAGYVQFSSSRRVCDDRSSLRVLAKQLDAYENSQPPLSPSTVFQLSNYTHAYLSWSKNLRDSAGSPRVLLFANDHSPNQVACSMVAKELGIPRIYMQHAEVTKLFPDLDFEIAILRNEASREIYEQAGPLPTGSFSISREKEPFRVSEFSLALSGRPLVGIYLTAQVEWSGVRRVLDEVDSNSRVRGAFLKPHPGMPRQLVARECPGARIEYEIPSISHIAVVANSSVVVELLHRSIPVFQNYGMDSVPDDYYGFSRTGIAPEVSVEDLQEPFWQRFVVNEAWLSAFSRYDPQADENYPEQEEGLADTLRLFFSPVGGRDVRPERLPEIAWSSAPAMAADLLRCTPESVLTCLGEGREEDASLSDQLYVRAADDLYAHRDPKLYDVFASSRRTTEVGSEFIFHTKRRDIELTGRLVASGELEAMTDFLLSVQEEKFAERLNIQFVLLLLRLSEHQMLKDFYERVGGISLKRMHVNHRIALARWLRERPARQSEIGLDLIDLYDGLSEFLRLKLRLLSSTAAQYRDSGWTHEAVESLFIDAAEPGVLEDYLLLYKSNYDALRDRMEYMDVRWSADQCERLVARFADAIRTKSPFSLIRLSDGEGYVYTDRAKFFTIEDAKLRERHWWREELPEALRNRILVAIQGAVSRADVLGIPCIYRLWREVGPKTSSLLSSTQARGLAEVLMQVAKLNNARQMYSEEKCNLPVFSDPAVVENLGRIAKKVVIVGSATERAVRETFPTLQNLRYVPIPTHSRSVGNEKYGNLNTSLPFMCDQISEQVRTLSRPGDLVLIAAGVVGKIFVDDARQSGAVGLDVGSSLDEWLQTRIHSLH